jgi:hypothetical protein
MPLSVPFELGVRLPKPSLQGKLKSTVMIVIAHPRQYKRQDEAASLFRPAPEHN